MHNLPLLATERLQSLSIFDPASPSAASIRDLSFLVLAITGVIFVIVEGVLCYCVLRFRKRDSSGKEPPQVYGSKPVEIAWTAAPALIVFILMLVTARTLWEVKVQAAAPHADDRALYVTVTGHQWWWEYTYETHDGKKVGVTTANELHIPVGDATHRRRIYLTLESADVCHSFWVPRLAGKTDLIPGKTNHTWFETTKPGSYLGQCAEYCGSQHANMLIRVIAEPHEDFDKWLAHEQQPAADDPQVQTGKRLFLAQSCVNCHRIRGTAANGTVGPDLTHLMSRQTLAAGVLPNTPENLSAWVTDPQNVKPACLMPAFQLSAQDRHEIIRYLLSLR